MNKFGNKGYQLENMQFSKFGLAYLWSTMILLGKIICGHLDIWRQLHCVP